MRRIARHREVAQSGKTRLDVDLKCNIVLFLQVMTGLHLTSFMGAIAKQQAPASLTAFCMVPNFLISCARHET